MDRGERLSDSSVGSNERMRKQEKSSRRQTTSHPGKPGWVKKSPGQERKKSGGGAERRILDIYGQKKGEAKKKASFRNVFQGTNFPNRRPREEHQAEHGEFRERGWRMIEQSDSGTGPGGGSTPKTKDRGRKER